MRRVFGFVDVVEAAQGLGMEPVQLDQDFVRDPAKGGRGADRCGKGNFAGSSDIAGFDHRPVDGAKKAVANGLRQLRQVHVVRTLSAPR